MANPVQQLQREQVSGGNGAQHSVVLLVLLQAGSGSGQEKSVKGLCHVGCQEVLKVVGPSDVTWWSSVLCNAPLNAHADISCRLLLLLRKVILPFIQPAERWLPQFLTVLNGCLSKVLEPRSDEQQLRFGCQTRNSGGKFQD